MDGLAHDKQELSLFYSKTAHRFNVLLWVSWTPDWTVDPCSSSSQTSITGKAAAVSSSHKLSTCFLPSRPTMFFKPSTVSQSSKTRRTKPRRFKTRNMWKKTHLCGGNHHNLLEIIKCHFVATRCSSLMARGKERSSFRSNRKRHGQHFGEFFCTAPPYDWIKT